MMTNHLHLFEPLCISPPLPKEVYGMAMTEQDLSLFLGILHEPTHNRLPMDPLLSRDIEDLTLIFTLGFEQRDQLGSWNPDLWIDLLPWHSLN